MFDILSAPNLEQFVVKRLKREIHCKCPLCGAGGFKVSLTKKTAEGQAAFSTFCCDCYKENPREFREALAPRWHKPLREPGSFEWEYRNSAGKVICRHVRRRVRENENIVDKRTMFYEDGCSREDLQQVLPYRYDEAIGLATEKELPLIWAEGEQCVDALFALGLPAVTTIGGAGNLKAYADYRDLFVGIAVDVVIAPDCDMVGIRYAEEVADLIGGDVRWLYAYPDSWEWRSPRDNSTDDCGGGFDLYDWIVEQDLGPEEVLAAIVDKPAHWQPEGRSDFDDLLDQVGQIVNANRASELEIEYRISLIVEKQGLRRLGMTPQKLLAGYYQREAQLDQIESEDIVALCSETDEAYEPWIIGGILPPSSTIVVGGVGGSGKTSLVLDIARSVATGQAWNDYPVTNPGKVLVVSSDEPRNATREKCRSLDYHLVQRGMIEIVTSGWRFNQLNQMHRLLKRIEPRLVIIDSWTACHAGTGVDLNHVSAGDPIYALRDIAEATGTTFIILHHLSRSGDLRGSSSVHDNCSEVWMMEPTEPGSTNRRDWKIQIPKSRSGMDGTYRLQRSESSFHWHWLGDMDDARRMARMRVFGQVRAESRWRTVEQVAFDISANGSMVPAVHAALEHLRRTGMCESRMNEDAYGRPTRVYRGLQSQLLSISQASSDLL